jgi:hypothetical protein
LGQRRSAGRRATRASVSSAMLNASRAASSGGIAWISGRGVVDPVHVLRLGVGGRERHATLQLVGERQYPGIPERDMSEHGGDRPVLVHLGAKLVLVEALDQGAKALTLSRVLIDVRRILRHASETIPLAGGCRSGPPAARSPPGRGRGDATGLRTEGQPLDSFSLSTRRLGDPDCPIHCEDRRRGPESLDDAVDAERQLPEELRDRRDAL